MLYRYRDFSPQIDPSTFVSESATIIGNVSVGPRCFIGPGAVIRADTGRIVIDEETAVEDGVIIHSGSGGEMRIGRRVVFGHGAIVHSRTIADRVSVGMGAVLSLLSEIGENAVVAECALVKKGQIIPPNVLVGGIPCKILRPLEQRDYDLWEKSRNSYVALAAEYLNPALFEKL